MILIPAKVGDFYRIIHNGSVYYYEQANLELLQTQRNITENLLLSFAEIVISGNTVVKSRGIELQTIVEKFLPHMKTSGKESHPLHRFAPEMLWKTVPNNLFGSNSADLSIFDHN